DGIRDFHVTGVQTCALPISQRSIDTVGYGKQVGAARLQQPVQPAAELGRQYFPRVIRADDGDFVGACNTRMQEVDAVSTQQAAQIGRASCRERGEVSVVDVA